MVASHKGHLSVVKLLVSVGAQVNSQDNVSSYPIDMYVHILLCIYVCIDLTLSDKVRIEFVIIL